MEELIKELRLQIHERTSSPLLGSFLASWCFWNYKFLVILFSDASVTKTFSMIEQICFPSWWEIMGFGVFGPIVTAIAYIYVYPIPAKLVYEHSLQRQKEVAEIRQRIEDETPLTYKQYRQIRQNMSAQVEEHYKEIERRDLEIARLKSEIENHRNRKAEIPEISSVDNPKKRDASISDSEIRAISLIAENGGFIPNIMFKNLTNNERLKIEYDLGELVNKQLAAPTVQDGKSGYKLTHEGKGILLKLRAKNL